MPLNNLLYTTKQITAMISAYTEISFQIHKTEPLMRFTVRQVFYMNDEPVDSIDEFDCILSLN